MVKVLSLCAVLPCQCLYRVAKLKSVGPSDICRDRLFKNLKVSYISSTLVFDRLLWRCLNSQNANHRLYARRLIGEQMVYVRIH